MTSPSRAASSDGLGADFSPTVVKGAILIFVALVLGVVLLIKGTDTDTGGSAPDGGAPVAAPDGDGGSPDTTVAADTTDTTGATTTTEAPSEARPPEEVTVLVANASGIPGAASRVGEQLTADGYLIAEPDNAKEPATTTVVYYIEGFEPEAQAVAVALGLDPEADPDVVAEVPTPLPTVDENMGAANVLVILGTDLAPTS